MKHLASILIAFLLCSTAIAQKSDADKHYRLFEYSKAIPDYEQHLKKSGSDYEAWSRLALCYKNTNAVEKAANCYLQMMTLPQTTPNDIYELVQLYRILQRLGEAKKYAEEYERKAPGPKASNLLASIDRFNEFNATVNDFSVSDMTDRYPYSVLSVFPYNNELLVTAENEKGHLNPWTGRGYTDLFTTDAGFSKLTPFADALMTRLEDGMPAFSPDRKIIVWTSTNKETVSENNINTRKLHLVSAQLQDDGKWKILPDFPFNANAYNTAHPTISPDGTLLVFSSDMPGGNGGMDLYMCRKAGDSWSAPENIHAFNTEQNELFPMFQPDGSLIFSSNGWPGMGGLDLFVSRNDNGVFGKPENVKAPLNSSFDDYNLIYLNVGKSGYLASNRSGNMSIDHIYYFAPKTQAPVTTTPAAAAHSVSLKVIVKDKYTGTLLPYVSVSVKDGNGNILHKGLTDENGEVVIDELAAGSYTIQGILNDVTTTIATVAPSDFGAGVKEIERTVTHNDPRFTLKGIVLNTQNNTPLAGVEVTCINTTLGLTKKITTGADGTFLFQLEQKSDYRVSGDKKGWISSEVAEATTKGLDRTTQLYVKLTLNLEQPKNKAVIRLNNIQYDFDKCDINPKAALELDRLVKLMNDYPDMKIELSSHTDSRGSDEYNMKLSQCRAESAVRYLVNQGISPGRMTAKGYGETRLLNRCSNGVSCTEEEHHQNRRTEFSILQCASCP